MGIVSPRLPESLHKHLRELARRENVSMNQFITLAVAEKMPPLEAFEHALAKVPDVEPTPEDAL